MLVNTQAIVLSSVKYGEADLIVSCFTKDHGLKSYLLRGVRKSRKGKLRVSYFQPLTQLDLTAKHRDRGTLEQIREVRLARAYTTLHTDVRKSAIVLFLAELLKDVIREEEPDPSRYRYMAGALNWLDRNEAVANFHLLFLLRLTSYLGFYPDSSNSAARWFDLMEGVFVQTACGEYCEQGRAVELFKAFCGMDFDAIAKQKLNQQERREVLHLLIRYYRLHIDGFKEPRSLLVLNQLFH